ncbi:MAG: hypothetical protein EOM91_13535 [Sphingobacteriia bacterium]|nr:hypothetical protein [Sphingobacteriia bacterium]NCC40969.1 hypothetical protein [Gammaproteobacteria bacterium]
MDTDLTTLDTEARQHQRLRMARLDADIAYFEARLELLGALDSPHRVAQRRAYDLLLKSLSIQALQLKAKLAAGH